MLHGRPLRVTDIGRFLPVTKGRHRPIADSRQSENSLNSFELIGDPTLTDISYAACIND